jgi:hypothetical protein
LPSTIARTSSWINYIGTKGHIVEYFGGLSASKCAGTALGVTFKFPGGMVLDQKGDLVPL